MEVLFGVASCLVTSTICAMRSNSLSSSCNEWVLMCMCYVGLPVAHYHNSGGLSAGGIAGVVLGSIMGGLAVMVGWVDVTESTHDVYRCALTHEASALKCACACSLTRLL